MKIFNHPSELKEHLKKQNIKKKIYLTSGGFDPLHVGHLRCIQGTSRLAEQNDGITVIVVNGEDFLLRKKGYAFMPHRERMEIVAGIKGVDYVVGWQNESQTVTGAIEIILPNYFTKGGDRTSSENVPEFILCSKIGCEVIFNVGGEKIQSSSSLVDNATNLDVQEMIGYVKGFNDGAKDGKF